MHCWYSNIYIFQIKSNQLFTFYILCMSMKWTHRSLSQLLLCAIVLIFHLILLFGLLVWPQFLNNHFPSIPYFEQVLIWVINLAPCHHLRGHHKPACTNYGYLLVQNAAFNSSHHWIITNGITNDKTIALI